MKKYKLNKGHLTQKIDNNTTVFSGEDSILHTLNPTGGYIFQGIKLGWDEEKIIEGLVKKFKADPTNAKKDTNNFIRQLFKKKILIESE